MEKELANYGACDPVKVEEKRRAVTLAKEAAMRWTGTTPFLASGGDISPAFIPTTARICVSSSPDLHRLVTVHLPLHLPLHLPYTVLALFSHLFASPLPPSIAENYSVLLSHFTRQNPVNPEDIRKYLEIGEDYEDIL